MWQGRHAVTCCCGCRCRRPCGRNRHCCPRWWNQLELRIGPRASTTSRSPSWTVESFASSRFDVVICAFGLGFWPEHALPEMRRVLRDGGRLVISAPAGGGQNWNFFGELCERYGLVSAAHPGGTQMPAFDEVAKQFASTGFAVDPPAHDAGSGSGSRMRSPGGDGPGPRTAGVSRTSVGRRCGAVQDRTRSRRCGLCRPTAFRSEQEFLVLTATRVS